MEFIGEGKENSSLHGLLRRPDQATSTQDGNNLDTNPVNDTTIAESTDSIKSLGKNQPVRRTNKAGICALGLLIAG